ncbi:GAF domain-containing SpoIIE family protein phosphatase [Nitrosococcus oceani]|uniref:Protein phosphatase 2C-like, stage II sporulation E n=2 Tax=Nitrosococcus oceani TaxID=1229 RepID=Q3JEL0_NITOC|nr:SpoIIE family protein phosphatase [Nitrosococcus oceani]KFI20810.1 protein phosphatase [Nitrosococcus oceani C-27]ABA56736.1 protein phosphatase 2C-like, stage II sporulation E [Nitrosococcus oceani ATCC 19707]EDZ65783.1 Stage II sporulation protein E [Nitrosococcus oceani AFC27]KFI23904.1 protein phosphatase [Nitrosococcus oceani]GEM20493.1 protein phosphatase [Nitrosococcus oceani]
MNTSLLEGKRNDIPATDLLRLLEISRQLAIITDLQKLLAQIEHAALKIFACERATVFVFDHDSNELYSYVASRPEKIRFPARQGIAGECFHNNHIIKVSDAYKDPRFNPAVDDETKFKTHNILSCPLTTHDQTPIGVLQILNKCSGEFNQWDEILLRTLSAQCGVALERQFLLEQFVEKQRLQHDINIARQIQQHLLPKQPPAVEGFDIAAWNQPAEETGGDFFDYHQLIDGRLMLTIADVTGHGIGPALVAAQCHALQRAAFAFLPEIQQVATLVNRLLSEDIPDDRFVTVFFALLSPHNQELVFTSAGHGPILLFQAKDNQIQKLPTHGPPIGIIPNITYEGWDRLCFNQGDMLITFTDGFFEWVNPEGKPFGVERICKIVKNYPTLPAANIIQQIYSELLAYTQGVPQADDLTALLIKKN